VLIFLLLLLTLPDFAQLPLSVQSFRKLPNDLDARVNEPLKDQNGDLCAIIKVATTQTGFNFDCGQIGIIKTIQKLSEIWVYVPYGVKRLTIFHPQLGILRDYQIPISVEKATVYELVLITGKVVQSVEETIVSQWLAITPEPAEAMIYLNDNFVKSGVYQVKLKPGTYTYRVEAPMYNTEAGKIEIADSKKDLIVKLKPAFGYIMVNSEPENDAIVIIDGKMQKNTTPCQSEPLASGEHTVQVVKDMFQPVAQKVKVNVGQTTKISSKLIATFAEVTINLPKDATLYINNQEKGQGGWQGRLNAGVYSLEARQENHRPARQDIDLAVGDKKSVKLEPDPIYGTLDVLSNPTGASIKINGQPFGTTPGTIEKHLIGTYQLQLSKYGFNNLNKTIKIEEGKTTEVNEKLVALTAAEKSKTGAVKLPEAKPESVYRKEYYKYKNRKNVWLTSTIVTGSIGAVLYFQSNNAYTKYLSSTSDAASLQQKVRLFDTLYPIAFGAAGFSLVEMIINANKQGKAKKLPISFYPQSLPGGAGLIFACKF
jgi:hypothetical protein